MDRIDKIFEYIEPKLDKKVLENKEKINDEFLKNKEELKNQFLNKIISLIIKKGETNPIYIIISPLRSSLITEKYELALGLYNEELYLDKQSMYDYFSINFLFKYIESDIKEIKNDISKNFIRFLDFELREIILKYKSKYMDLYFDYIKDILFEIDDFKTDKKLIILYGEYMENALLLKEVN